MVKNFILEQYTEESVCAPPQSKYEKHFGGARQVYLDQPPWVFFKVPLAACCDFVSTTLNQAFGGHRPPEGIQIVSSGTRLSSSAGLEGGCSLARGKQQEL